MNRKTDIYDPILITPRHPYTNSPSSALSQEPIKDPLPDPPLNPKGKYFSAMVENGKGGDFFGYYYMTNSSSGITAKRKIYETSISKNNNPTDWNLAKEGGPHILFPSQNTRPQDNYFITPRERKKGGNHGNPIRGPCFNCKEYGHYSRDCQDAPRNNEAPTKGYYYSMQHVDTLPRSSKTESHPRHYPHSRNLYYDEYLEYPMRRSNWKPHYKEQVKDDDGEGYPLSDFKENMTPSRSKATVSGKQHNYPKVKLEHQLSDLDGDESDDDTYITQKPSNTTLDMSQQVNDVLSKHIKLQCKIRTLK